MRSFTRSAVPRYVALVAAVIVTAGACAEDGSPGSAKADAGGDSATPCYELGWKECPKEPYPYSTPLPPAEPTPIDGTYSREIDNELAGAPGKCKRCPPYRLEPGGETLTFDRGRYFVEHEPPGFRSSGHFWVEDDNRIRLFNDPSCSTFEGVYEWEVADGVLRLHAVEDECPFTQLRQRFLMAKDWQLVQGGTDDAAAGCDPPSEEAAVTGHWPIPKGCEVTNES